jgi:hypothetical protein
VLGASDPREALRLSQIRSEPIHLLVTGVVMPFMTGRELAVKLHIMRPGIKVLFMSEFTSSVIENDDVQIVPGNRSSSSRSRDSTCRARCAPCSTTIRPSRDQIAGRMIGVLDDHFALGRPRRRHMAGSAPRMIPARTSVRLAAMLLLLGMSTSASAGDVAELMAPLLAAREREAFGSVDGRAYAEGQRGGAEPTPYSSVSVLLLPRSPEFDAVLEAIKARFRDSPDAYLEAEPKLSAARLAYERALIDAGGGQLLLGESSDAAGAFRFGRVPEGAWTLLAWREIPGAKHPPSLKPSEAQRYKTRPQIFGYTTVIFWRIPLQVKGGEEMTVRLHDRNEWLTGVREDRRIPDPNQPNAPQGQPGKPGS